MVLIFICCSKEQALYKEIQPTTIEESNNFKSSSTGIDKASSNGYINLAGSTPTQSLACSRPPGTNGIIACSSYKNRLGELYLSKEMFLSFVLHVSIFVVVYFIFIINLFYQPYFLHFLDACFYCKAYF